MKDLVRIGVVGAGLMSQRAHVPNLLAEDERCRVVALADARVETAGLVASRYHIPAVYSSLEDMLAGESVDALVLSVPDPIHRELSIAAMTAGKHVFMEKPLATTLEDGRAIVDTAKRANVRLQLAYQRRHDPAAEQVRDIVRGWSESGEMGRLRLIRYQSLGGDWQCRPDGIMSAGDSQPEEASAYKWPEWLPGHLHGPWAWFNNYTSHALDLISFWIGPPTGVITSHPEPDPASVVMLDWAGARAVLVDGPAQPGVWEEWIELHYEGGWLRFSSPPALHRNVPGTIEIYRGREGRREVVESPPEWAFRREITHFLRSVAEGIPESPTPDEALATLTVVDAVFRHALEMGPARAIGL